MSALTIGLFEALVASLWQAPAVAVLAMLVELAGAERASTRYVIRSIALLSIPTLVVGTVVHGMIGPSAALLGGTWSAGLAVSTTFATGHSASWISAVMGGWMTGILLMSARVAVSWRRMDRLRRAAWPVPSAWRPRVRRLAQQLGLPEPRVGVSPECESPLLLGVLRPMVLLPVGLLTSVPPTVVEAALAHELMHLRRLDPWLHAAQTATEILLFFNPAVWWLSWRMGTEREHACDEAVLLRLRRPARSYARALVELEQWRHRPMPAMTLGVAGGSLRARVQQLIRPRTVGPGTRWSARLAVLAAVVLGMLLGWMPRSTTPPEPTGATPIWLPSSVLRHEGEITEAAARHGVDPSLLAVMVWAESRGRPDARSPVGARGLLQLMPSTADEIAQRRGLGGHSADKLDEPAYNLDFGAWYLARQLEHYGEVQLAVAAYNAGPGRVSAVQRGEAALPEQTQRYQSIVMSLWSERWWPWSPTLAKLR